MSSTAFYFLIITKMMGGIWGATATWSPPFYNETGCEKARVEVKTDTYVTTLKCVKGVK